MRNLGFPAIAAIAISLFAALPASAAPNREACGGIDFRSIGECHFEVEGGCKAKCQPLNLVASCDGKCTATIVAECDTSCSAQCQTDCNANANFDCKGACEADCNGRIAADCGSDQECISYCQADCRQSCEFECNADIQADCNSQCGACCQGSCDVDANFDCSINCSAELRGGCEVACDSPEGALFCDGQYINVLNLDDCLAYLASNFEVKAEARVEGKATISACSMSPVAAGGAGAGLFAASVGLLLARRRRSSSRAK